MSGFFTHLTFPTSMNTPSPGPEYDSLLLDTQSKIYSEEESNPEKIVFSHSSNNNSSLHDLKSENYYLKAQLKTMAKEKEMHISANAQEKLKLQKQLRIARESLEKELIILKKENAQLLMQTKDLTAKLRSLICERNENNTFFKKQLIDQEKHYQLLLKDKDRLIHELQGNIGRKKAKKIELNTKKKNISRRISALTSCADSPIMSPMRVSTKEYKINPSKKLDEITELIVRLEKEKAEMKANEADLEEISGESVNFKSLKELSHVNQDMDDDFSRTIITRHKYRLSSAF
jgi:hypothetical protein